MQTTLQEIKDKYPCSLGWITLLKYLNKTRADKKPLSFKTILKSNGIEDAVWCLCVLDYKDVCLFTADVAELVLPIFENYSSDTAPRNCIAAIRDYHANKISLTQLRLDAYDAAAVNATGRASFAARTAFAAANTTAFGDDNRGTYNTVINAVSAIYANKLKWKKIEILFIKHFLQLNLE